MCVCGNNRKREMQVCPEIENVEREIERDGMRKKG